MEFKLVVLLGFIAIIGFSSAAYNRRSQSGRHSSYTPPAHYPAPRPYHRPSVPYHQPAKKPYVVKYWSQWGYWSQCTKTCGYDGEQRRYRTCLTKTQYGYGNNHNTGSCYGSNYARRRCNQKCCPVNGNWGHWSEWAVSHGYQYKRTRQCNYPAPKCGGRDCYGNSHETKTVHPPQTPAPYHPPKKHYQPTYQPPPPHYPAPHRRTPSYRPPHQRYPTPHRRTPSYQPPAQYPTPHRRTPSYRPPHQTYPAPHHRTPTYQPHHRRY